MTLPCHISLSIRPLAPETIVWQGFGFSDYALPSLAPEPAGEPA